MRFWVMMDIFILIMLMHVLHDVDCYPHAAPTADTTTCGAGRFWDESGQCQPCPDGTFMTEEMAKEQSRYPQCARCHSPDEPTHQVAINYCTKIEDTLIGCKDNYYKKNVSSFQNSINSNLNFECTPCAICGVGRNREDKRILQFEKLACHDFTDTVCCKNDSMIVENGKCMSPPTLQLGDSGTTRTNEPGKRTPEDDTETIADGTETPENVTETPENVTETPEDVTETPWNVTETTEDGTETTEHGSTHQRNCSDVLFPNSSLVFVACFLCALLNWRIFSI